ncbi:FAD binding domain-containing protein [Microbacterium hominis]|uniref:FAD binding domain-containing protein n=1 Tax=Microbacterium hominis TaxID=162426 RepID=UPI00077C58CF|nr:FAD-dependent monooxygenase [Microbacterium hominis]
MRTALRVGVIGGSLGGLFTAALLHQAGHDVTVLERSRAGLARRGAGLVGQQDLFDVLARLGLTSVLRSGVEARERITLGRRGDVLHRDPTPQTQLSWDYIYDGLRALIPAGRYRLGSAVTEVRSDGRHATVRIEDGTTIPFDLVVGADGLNSVVRRAVAPERSDNRYVGYLTWRGLVPEAALPERAAETLLERFAFYTAPGAHMLGYLVPGPDGQTAPGRRRYNWVWYRTLPSPELERLMVACGHGAASTSLAPGDLPADLRQSLVAAAAAELPVPFADAVAAEPRPFLQALYDYVAPRMAAPSVALVGDAAVVVRPHTAMGAAKAAGDAMALVDLLGTELSLADALATYDRDRLPVGRAIARYGQELGDSLPL